MIAEQLLYSKVIINPDININLNTLEINASQRNHVCVCGTDMPRMTSSDSLDLSYLLLSKQLEDKKWFYTHMYMFT